MCISLGNEHVLCEHMSLRLHFFRYQAVNEDVISIRHCKS